MKKIFEPKKRGGELAAIIATAIAFTSASLAKADSFGLGAAGPSYWGVLETGTGQVSFSGPATYNGAGAAGIYGTATQANVGINTGGKLNASDFTIDGTYYRYASNNDSIEGEFHSRRYHNGFGKFECDF